MTIEHPRFPTPEDERKALLLYEALRKSAESDTDILRGSPPKRPPMFKADSNA